MEFAKESDSDITLQQLRCFIAAVDHGAFMKAANHLGISQPSLSAHISNLEEALGVELFDRTRRPARLTGGGEEMVGLARRALTGVDDILTGVGEVLSLTRGLVRVGVTPSLGTTLLPKILSDFKSSYPGIVIEVREKGSDELESDLNEGALDLALVTMTHWHSATQGMMLYREDLVAIVNYQHTLADRDEIYIRELDDEDMIMFRQGYDLRTTTQAAMREAGVSPKVSIDGAEISSVKGYVEAGLGVAVVPEGIVAGSYGIKAIRLVPRVTREIGVVTGRGLGSRASRAMFEQITSTKTPLYNTRKR